MLYLEDKLPKMINELSNVIPKKFGPYDCDGGECDYSLLYDIETVVHKYYKHTNIDYGVSKMAIIIEELPFVIKIPFNGSWYTPTEIYDNEIDDCRPVEEDDDVDDEFCPFFYANDVASNDDAAVDDYCENELIKYEKAKENHLECFFAKTMFYTAKNGIKFYLQQKVFPYSYKKGIKLPNDTIKKVLSEVNVDRMTISSNWIAQAILRYGSLAVENFLNYISENNLDDDLHYGNYGFTEDESPILIDWAGWRD